MFARSFYEGVDRMTERFTNDPGQRLDVPDPATTMEGRTMGGSPYTVVGTTLQAVRIKLKQNAMLFTETGSMAWMQDGISMNTNAAGGLGGMFKRALTGESLFVVDFQAQREGAEIAFASDFPGKILPINLAQGQAMVTQKQAFLVGEKSVEMNILVQQRLGAGLFGGEGFILQKFIGPGTIFVALDGEIVEHTLGAGERLKVDTGHVGMFEPTVQFNIEMVKGFKNVLFGGEGLFLTTLTGPGRVWLQTMPMSKLAGSILATAPREGSTGINFG
jgi:uncharacterized protein (TIGR00266 family)